MNDYRNLESKFKNEIEGHIKKALPNLFNEFSKFRQSSEDEDGKLSFDLVFDMNFVISIRIRKNAYIKYNDMTIRYRSKNGYKTEFDKIKEGLAQVYFYAYMSEDEKNLCKIRICNVEALRNLIDLKQYKIYENLDGTKLATFKFSDIKDQKGNIYQFN